MNCGLGNLDGLKRHLLAGSMAGDRRFDEVIVDIGLGVANEMETYCGRKFARSTAAEDVFPADRTSFVLSRQPLEEITKVELKESDTAAWVTQAASFVISTSLKSGLVYLPETNDAGPYWAQVRFTYKGGYWFETLEPEESGYPGALPAGAAELPKGLRLAWLNQCREVWNACDKLGSGLVDKPGVQTVIGKLDYSSAVKRVLGNYMVMEMI